MAIDRVMLRLWRSLSWSTARLFVLPLSRGGLVGCWPSGVFLHGLS